MIVVIIGQEVFSSAASSYFSIYNTASYNIMSRASAGPRRVSVFDAPTLGEALLTNHTRPKILALCGAKSNDAVTKLQLENLHVTEKDYDIYYLHGNIEEEEGDEALEGLVHGPFYSWIDPSNENAMNESIVNSVRLVMKVVNAHGPFDGVYGFSNGKIISYHMLLFVHIHG